MKYLVAAVFLVVGLGIAWFSQGVPSGSNDCNCDQQIAGAVWFALNQVDCDGSNEQDAPCQDELDQVNVAPLVTATRVKSGWVSVYVRVSGKFGEHDFTVTFDKQGILAGASGT
jgi:hypothetical protein